MAEAPATAAAPAADDAASKYRVSTRFRGADVCVLQTPRDRTDDGQDNTGWCVWETSNIVLRYLARDEVISALLARSGKTYSGEYERLKMCDLSSGAGLVALALAGAGAHVTATDVPAQLPQLQFNVDAAGLGARVRVEPLFWGESVRALTHTHTHTHTHSGTEPEEDADSRYTFDICVASDIIFIALRDGRTEELRRTLHDMAAISRVVIFAFEERLCHEEQEFMESLGLGIARGTSESCVCVGGCGCGLEVEEVKGPDVTVSYEDSLKGAGGHPDTDLWNPALFWEPPPVRMFLLHARTP